MATVRWKTYDDMLSRFRTIPACYGRTDGQTELLYQYRASAAVCWRAIKMNDPKVFKLGIENDLGIAYRWLYDCRVKRSRLWLGLGLQKRIEDDRVAGVRVTSMYTLSSCAAAQPLYLKFVNPFTKCLPIGQLIGQLNFLSNCVKIDNKIWR